MKNVFEQVWVCKFWFNLLIWNLVHFLLQILHSCNSEKNMKTTLACLIIFFLFSCERNELRQSDSRLILTRSQTEFENIVNHNATGDQFTINSVEIRGDSVFVTVGYSGGCNPHNFKIVWGETFTETYPPQADILIIHDAAGDKCEALVTETLAFRIPELIGTVDYESIILNLHNTMLSGNHVSDSWYPSDYNVYNVIIPQGDECQVEVTFSSVICGAGLWENQWFALNDSVDAGIEGSYFKKWLQPVSISDDMKDFRPVPGKKYLVGARLQEEHPYTGVVVCLAYSGPSIPVKITCITELE